VFNNSCGLFFLIPLILFLDDAPPLQEETLPSQITIESDKSELTEKKKDDEVVDSSEKKLTDSSDKDKENQLLIDTVKPLLKQEEEETSFKVIYNRGKYDVSFPLNLTVMELKTHLETIIGK